MLIVGEASGMGSEPETASDRGASGKEEAIMRVGAFLLDLGTAR
jgi:hypothetical protein